jgi:prepilin-type N-terminal cleavage/methylation domain-containing protein
MRRRARNQGAELLRRGFTLIELMIVVAIIAILAAFLAPSVSQYMDRAQAQSAARDVTNMMRMARNQAMSRGEVILAEVTTSTEGGTVELFRTDDGNGPALSCSQAGGMGPTNWESVRTYDMGTESPDMALIGADPDVTVLCFSPSGRVLNTSGLAFSQGDTDGCKISGVRLWVRRADPSVSDAAALKNDPLGGSHKLTACLEDQSEIDAQRQGREVAHFWNIWVPYNGAVTMEQ